MRGRPTRQPGQSPEADANTAAGFAPRARSEPARPDVRRQDRLGADSASASIIWLTPRRGTIARTATQSGSASGATVGDSRPGVIAVARPAPSAGSRSRASGTAGRTPRPAAALTSWSRAAPRRLAARPLPISTASDSHSGSPKATRSCWRRVRPEPTTSAIASATPSCTEISTAPSSRMTVASMPCAARSFRTRFGYAVAIRLPARSAIVQSWPGRSGVAEGRRAEAERRAVPAPARRSRRPGPGR